MRIPDAEHHALDWQVHAQAKDFDLLDVWRFPIVAEPEVALGTFLEFMERQQAELATSRGPAGLLFRLRGWLGRVFGWDEVGRSPEASEEANLPFDTLYRTDEESLSEIQNATVHALMHIGRVPVAGGWSPQMAVYVRPRGRLGRFYKKRGLKLRAIKQFEEALKLAPAHEAATRELRSLR